MTYKQLHLTKRVSNTTPFPTTSNCYSGVFDAWTIALPIYIKKSNICILELCEYTKKVWHHQIMMTPQLSKFFIKSLGYESSLILLIFYPQQLMLCGIL